MQETAFDCPLKHMWCYYPKYIYIVYIIFLTHPNAINICYLKYLFI